MKNRRLTQAGSVIVSILVVTLFLTTVIFALLVNAEGSTARARGRILLLQAQYAAESGADAALATLNSGNTSYTGTTSDIQVMTNGTLYKATYGVAVTSGGNDKTKLLTATGKVYAPANATAPSYTRKIEVRAERSTTETSSSMLSRNIIDIGSGVKNIWGVDIYVNSYINMNKNTTNLIAENITVAGKNTGASNCSIGGSGNLLKPSSFLHAGQTKTNITVGYNNCISPPGNTTNSSFNVTANTSVSTVASTDIPWSQYMNGYNPGSCTDWTTGGSTRNIPSVNGSKNTQYPDSSNNISTSCGSSGDIDLGSNTYNITDNAHIRANFCKASACDPTFNNSTGSIKFIFLEGTANFQSLHTSAGSGPIVLVTYGADPNSHGSACPSTDGDSLYLGQHGNNSTVAPALYLLAKNGLCIDQTKFDNTNPSLGGVSGKNLYIAASPGNPFDLKLDPSFPVSQIPIDLSWKAVRFRRL